MAIGEAMMSATTIGKRSQIAREYAGNIGRLRANEETIGPGSRGRPELQLALQKAFPPSMSVAALEFAFQGRRSIDHIALSEDWQVASLDVISNFHEGKKLSDHSGTVAELSFQNSQ